MAGTNIRWRLVLTGGLLAEIAIFAVVAVVRVFLGEQPFLYSVPIACLVMTFAFGFWTGRRAPARPLAHGTLAGVVAALLYIVITIGQTLPALVIASHGIKVVGGFAGGLVAERQARRRRTLQSGDAVMA